MNQIQRLLRRQSDFFNTGLTRNVAFRIDALRRLKKAVIDHEEAIYEALDADFKKPRFETYVSEIGVTLDEIKYAIKKTASWAKPRKVRNPLLTFPSRSYIHVEPYGLALIIAAWNYPVNLAIAPLAGAIAAGNCAVIKPSEHAPQSSSVIARIIASAFDEEYIAVVEGDVETSRMILKEKFDFILFTGSIGVGKIVMEAASRHLTPVALELGGKSPAIVDADADVKLAARRIVWGKFINAGQTCIAPDYVMVHRQVKTRLIDEMKNQIREFYGDDARQSSDYPRIINNHHFRRLAGLMKTGKIVFGGDRHEGERYIEPTIIEDITWHDPIMQEEIFGPILPVMVFDDLDRALGDIRKRPRPLALYYFSRKSGSQKRVVETTCFGGGCINDTVVHFTSRYLPFGGVGTSGMGSYHGRAGFDMFSHRKSILRKSRWLDISLRYPPYAGKLKKMKAILK